MRFFLLVLCFFSAFATAAEKCKRWTYSPGTSFFTTAAEACSSLAALKGGSSPTVLGTSGNNCQYVKQVPCSTGMCSQLYVGAVYETEVACEQDPAAQCQAKVGTPEMVNYTVGWKRTSQSGVWDDYVHVNKLPPGGSVNVCNQGCQQTLDANAPCPDCKAWVSQVPGANGLYRASMDMMGSYTGSTCSPGPADSVIVPDDSKDPPCPGYVGEVNGVRGCYGTAQAPITQVSADRPPPAVGQDTGNPSAGTKPSSGEGSGTGGAGRTPSSGTGGSAGGPAGAIGSGVKPDGTTAKPVEGKEQAACGAPGQPKCGIDETGTPTGKGAYDEAKAGLDKAEGDFKAGLDSIKSTADKDTSWGVVPSWIAHAECRPWDLGAFEIMGQSFAIVISICDVMPYVVATTSFLWVVATFFLTIAMVFRVTAAPQG